MTVRVLICDDQALVRAGFRKLLEAIPDLEVVGEAEDGLQVVELARRRTPDVVLMDIRMPRLDGIEAARRIVADSGRAVKVLMLTTFGNDEYVYASLRAGASAFLLKDAPPEELVAAIHIVARGDALLAPAVTRAVIEAFVRSSPARPDLAATLSDLTPREVEVFELLAQGRSNSEIADALMLSGTTVKTHVGHVLMKLGVRDRVQAVIFAYESGIVAPLAAAPELGQDGRRSIF
jgi:DNA-binding NarL/FixJ family response regulator